MQIAVELSHRGRVFASGGPGEVLRPPDPGPWGLALRIVDERVAQAATGRPVVATGTKSYPGEAGPFDESELTWTEEIRFTRIRTRGGRDVETQGLSGEGGAGLVLATSGALLAGLVKRRNAIAGLTATRPTPRPRR